MIGQSRRRARRGPPGRRFTLLDAMILVAGVAIGFAGLSDRRGAIGLKGWLAEADDLGGFTLMLASCLVLAFRLRRPRPPIRKLARQPGAVACFAAAAYGLAYDAEVLARMAWDRRGGEGRSVEGWVYFLFEGPAPQFAYIVPICWLLLVLGRRWRPEAGWIDRAGRLVGWGWIAWAIAYPYLP